ncbi:MAG: glutathione S-transferase family protein [Pararhodobacter sp.]|nr:glutathione S-transferase family protein [Pararhodobacter sp.]
MAQHMTGRYALYWEAMSGAMAVELLLEEIGTDYERIAIDMAAGEHKSESFLSRNPTGQIPALRLPEGATIGESAAIILTLGERHPGAMVPAPDDVDRPAFLRWLIYMAASPYMTFVQFNHPYRFLDDPQAHDALIANARSRLLKQFSAIEGAISGAPFFLPRGANALDLYLYMLVEFYDDHAGLFEGRPKLEALHGAVAARDSVGRIRPGHGQ